MDTRKPVGRRAVPQRRRDDVSSLQWPRRDPRGDAGRITSCDPEAFRKLRVSPELKAAADSLRIHDGQPPRRGARGPIRAGLLNRTTRKVSLTEIGRQYGERRTHEADNRSEPTRV
jgi:hypothetical protein